MPKALLPFGLAALLLDEAFGNGANPRPLLAGGCAWPISSKHCRMGMASSALMQMAAASASAALPAVLALWKA